jgi:hypothetical protein
MADQSKHEIVIKGKDEYSKTIDDAGKKTEGLTNKVRLMGAAMAAAGAAGIAMITNFVKSAAEEEAGIMRLQTAMRNVGLSYDQSREKLEEWIDANQQATSFADSEQREALSQLIIMTRNLEQSQSLLTLAMDMSIGTGRDLSSTVQTLSYAIGGNWGMVERLLPALKEVQTEEEKWRLLHELFAGQAKEFGETAAGQFKTLKNNVDDVKESMGSELLPTLIQLLKPLESLVNFMKQHPVLAEFAAKAMLIGTSLLVVAGASKLVSGSFLTSMIPALVSLARTIWVTVIPALKMKIALLLSALAAQGPVGWAILGASIAGIAALVINLPKLINKFQSMDVGGRVAAPYGAPTLVMARGGEEFSGFPPRRRIGEGVTININAGAFTGKEEDAREFARIIYNQLRIEDRRTVK